MDIDAKLDLCNQAYDAIRKLEKVFADEARSAKDARRERSKIDLRRRASEICQKILFLDMAISVDDGEE